MYPILFTIPFINIPIYSYGVMLGTSLIFAWVFIMRVGSKDGLSREVMGNCFIFTAVSAMIGARLLYIITNPDTFTGGKFFDYLNIRQGGLVAYGGFLGGFFGSWFYMSRKKIRLLAWADVAVPTLATGLGITRWGCFMYGCDFGKPTDLPWAVSFPNWKIRFPELYEMMNNPEAGGCMKGSLHGAPAWAEHVSQGLIDSSAEASLPVHPTQLYESLDGWIMFGILMLIWKRRYFRGQIFLIFTMMYGVTRSLFEIIRGDAERGSIGVLSTSQFVGIATFILALVFYIILHKKAQTDPQAAMALGPGAEEHADESQPAPARRPKRKKKKKK